MMSNNLIGGAKTGANVAVLGSVATSAPVTGVFQCTDWHGAWTDVRC